MSRDHALAAAVLAAAPAFLVGAALAISYPPNHDVSWLMYAAGRWLDGARLYRDVVEVNPPLIVWLSALPEWLARVTGAWPATVFRVLVLALATASLWLVLRLLRPQFPGAGPLALIGAGLAFAATAAPLFEFGQREHLCVLAVLPYLVLLGRRVAAREPGESAGDPVGRGGAIAVGLLAGVGFALKPFFLAAWLLPELYAYFTIGRGSLRRPELRALLASFAAYAVAVLLFARDYFELARIAAGAYGAYMETSPLALFRLRTPQAALAVLALWAGVRRLGALRATGDGIALALIGFLAGVLAQRKGWFYHWIPVVTLTVLLGGLVIAALHAFGRARLAALRTRAWDLGLGGAAAAVALLLVLRTAPVVEGRRAALTVKAFRIPELLLVVERHGRGGPIAALSTNMQAGFPLLDYADVEWGIRLNSLWPLAGAYPPQPVGTTRFPYHEPAAMPPGERYLWEVVIGDLLRSRPTVLIVDRMPPAYVLHGFDYLEYFGRDPRFAALLREYREAAPVERYRILVRTP